MFFVLDGMEQHLYFFENDKVGDIFKPHPRVSVFLESAKFFLRISNDSMDKKRFLPFKESCCIWDGCVFSRICSRISIFIHPQDYGKRAISKISFLKGIFKNLRIRWLFSLYTCRQKTFFFFFCGSSWGKWINRSLGIIVKNCRYAHFL